MSSEDRRAAAHNQLMDIFEKVFKPDDFRRMEKTLHELKGNPKLSKSEHRKIDDLLPKLRYVIEHGIPRSSRLSD